MNTGRNRARLPETFNGWLATITCVGLLIRLAYLVLIAADNPLSGDAAGYHLAANLFADGLGFPEPFRHYFGAIDVIPLGTGLWIAVAPFTRPLPGGAPFSFESTPEVGCRTPLVGAFVEDRPTADAYSTPRPQVDDPMAPTTVDCGGRATFRLVLGTTLVIVAVGLYVIDRRRGG